MQEILLGDNGFIIGWVMVAWGASDLLSFWWVLARHPQLLRLDKPGRLNIVTALLGLAVFVLLSGIYLLSYHL